MDIRFGYAPDPDNAFMYYALAEGKVDTGPLRFELTMESIPQLNDRAYHNELEASAISVHTYAYVQDRYALAGCGGAFGMGCGPVVVARNPMGAADLTEAKVAVPGSTTTAYLLLQLFSPALRTQVLPPDKIIPAVQTGVVDCGLILHGGQVLFERLGLEVVLDLADWWAKQTDRMPLPLVCNVVSRRLDPSVQKQVADVLAASIRYGLDHREDALDYATRQAAPLSRVETARLVDMYVNDFAVDMGETGKAAMEHLLTAASKAELVPEPAPLKFVGTVGQAK